MGPDIRSSIVSAIVGLVSGSVVAVFNHLLTKRKTAAEIEKLQAEAELTRAQAKQITENLTNLSDKVSYKLPDAAQSSEDVLFTSDKSDLFDFRVVKADNAEGELTVKDSVLDLLRTNVAGTMQIWLENYSYAGRRQLKILPKDESLPGDRKLRISCEVKAIGGEHTLLFVIKGENAPVGVHMADKRHRVTTNEWTAVDIYFRVSPGQNCHFRIDDRSVSTPNSSVQIRKLVLAQRTAQTLADSVARLRT
jgi:Tfp pilus assembly protein FimT